MPQVDIWDQQVKRERRLSLSLTVTQDCNLRCRYCYEPTKPRNYMSLQTAQEAITYYMEVDDTFEAIEIDFFGGEPMLAFDLIRDVVEWFHSRPWPKAHIFFIGTNGTVLTDEMKKWLVRHKECVKIGLSLDGNKAAHDVNRSNSYDQVMRNLPFFMEHWSDQPIKMTISAESIPHVADSIIEMEEMGLVFSANLPFEDIWGPPETKAALIEEYARQLDRLVTYYASRPELFPARIVDRKPEVLYQPDYGKAVGEDCIRFCGAGHEMVMVDVDGKRYPCHRFSPWVTGRPEPTELVNRQTSWQPQMCADCALISACPTCAGFNWQENGNTGLRTTYHCQAVKQEVLASAKLQALRLLQKQPQDLIELSPDEAYQAKRRLDAILTLASEGV
jgi:radical SAM protein with 4Fe4S-binding SPASM domain